MAVPTYKELLNPTLVALHEAGGSATIQEIREIVARNLGLSEETLNFVHGNKPQTELEYRLAWARTYLKKYGLITNSTRGVWSLTSTGRTTASVDPDDVFKVYQTPRRRGFGIDIREPYDSGAGTSDEGKSLIDLVGGLSPDDIENVLQTLEAAPWQEQLITAVHGLPPDAFERLCQRMLRESGFVEVTVSGRSGDGGIDGHGILRLGGLVSFPVYFQCKRYSGSVGAGVVRDFRGAMAGRSDKGLIITTGTFTRDAMKEATRDGAPPIDLIDGDLLAEKLKQLGLGVRTEMVEQVTVYKDFFEGI